MLLGLTTFRLSGVRAFSAADGIALQKAFKKGHKNGAAAVPPPPPPPSSLKAADATKIEPVVPKKEVIAPPPPVAAKEAAAAAAAATATAPFTFTQGHFNEFAPRITVVGVGGAGGNAVNNMIARNLSGVDFLVCNTDAQHLSTTLTDNRLQLGCQTTEGLGCGANPDAGMQAALESMEDIREKLTDSHMVFITAGMGGGTGTGAAPVIADICMQAGILTVAVVTKPFRFEGTHRMRLAAEGLNALQQNVDTMIVVPNQNLFKLVDQNTSLMDSFRLADNVLLAGVKSVTDLMVNPGLINLDFADVQSVMQGMGNAIMGTGQAEGEDRAIKAAEDALQNPLLGDIAIKSAKGMLVNITGGSDMTLFEVDRAAERITQEIEDQAANIIFGSAYDDSIEGSMRVSLVATGLEDVPL